MCKQLIFLIFLIVGNLKPKLKLFFKPKLRLFFKPKLQLIFVQLNWVPARGARGRTATGATGGVVYCRMLTTKKKVTTMTTVTAMKTRKTDTEGEFLYHDSIKVL